MSPTQLLGLKVAAAALVVGLSVGGGITYGWFSPRLELERVRADGLGDRLSEQNKAIEHLEQSLQSRAEVIGRLLASAEAARAEADKAVVALRGRPQPSGVNACEAADSLINEELAR